MTEIELQRLWPRETIVECLREALDITEELKPPDDLRLQTFNVTVQLVTQRAMPRQIGSVHLPESMQLGG